MMSGSGRWSTLLAGVGILIAVIALALVIGDLAGVGEAWRNLRWQAAIWLVPLGVLDHLLRYCRWQVLLRRVSAVRFTHATAFLLYSAGSLLVFTPGRAGEVAKSLYARSILGIPVATSLPVIVAERLTDALIMALLAAAGLLLIGQTPGLVLGGIILVTLLLVWLARKAVLKRLPWMRPGSSIDQVFKNADTSQRRLLAPPTIGINFAFGSSAWLIEVLIYYLSLCAAGAMPDFHLFLVSLAIFPLSSLAGSLSFLPGGLGVTEGGLIGLGIVLGGLSRDTALLAALLSRTAILGVMILAGILSMAFARALVGVKPQVE